MLRALHLFLVHFVLFSAVISICCAQTADAERVIKLFVPAFTGPKALGRSVGTILALQVFSTFRKSAGWGEGKVQWGPKPLPELTHRIAEAGARYAKVGGIAQIVLWGTADYYGEGALVQAFLSVPEYEWTGRDFYRDFRRAHKETWAVRITGSAGRWEFQQDIPRRRLHFAPIVMKRNLIQQYTEPAAIRLYDKNNPLKDIGSVSPKWEARISERYQMLVRSQGREGIVKLPELSENRTEVADYTSGLIRIFRGDWEGAVGYFDAVAKNLNAPTDTRIDAYLYQVFAHAMLGGSGAMHLESARALNPYASRTLRYAIMDGLAELGRALEKEKATREIDAVAARVARLISNNRHMFPEKEPWLEEVISFLKIIGRNEQAHKPE